MKTVFIAGIVFSGIILVLLVVAATLFMIFRMRQGGSLTQDRNKQNEEATMIQEIYTGLSRMEQRVEALETILMEQKKKDET
ncbi:MAG: phage-shock protein [Desulfobacterium sp.]